MSNVTINIRYKVLCIHNMAEVFSELFNHSWDDFNKKYPKVVKGLWLDKDLLITRLYKLQTRLKQERKRVLSCVIAVSGYSYDLNRQQCLYKALCQSHMKKHMKNVLEGRKYDCTSCDYNNGDRLERSIYQRNIYLYTMGSHLDVTFVNTRMITKMVSIVTSRNNT